MGIVQCTYCSQMHHCCRTLCQSHYTQKKTRNKNRCKNLRDGISRGRQHTIYSREKLYNARTSFDQDKYKFCLLNFTQKQFCRSIINGDNQYIIFKVIIIIKFTNDILSNDNNNWWGKNKTFNFIFVLLQSMLAIFSTFKAYIAILYSKLSEFMVTVSEFTE